MPVGPATCLDILKHKQPAASCHHVAPEMQLPSPSPYVGLSPCPPPRGGVESAPVLPALGMWGEEGRGGRQGKGCLLLPHTDQDSCPQAQLMAKEVPQLQEG